MARAQRVSFIFSEAACGPAATEFAMTANRFSLDFHSLCHTAAANHTSQYCNTVSTPQIAKTKQDLTATYWLIGSSNLKSKFVLLFFSTSGISCSSKTFCIFRFSFKTKLITWNYETNSLDVASHSVFLPPPLACLKSLSLLFFLFLMQKAEDILRAEILWIVTCCFRNLILPQFSY